MLSRFRGSLLSWGTWIVRRTVVPVIEYLFRDFIHLYENSKKHPEGVATAKIGPYHLVYISSHTSEEKAFAQLKDVLDIKGEKARHHYAAFDFFIGANFFLSMNDEKALQIRRELLPYFNPNRVRVDYAKETQKLICTVNKNFPDAQQKKEFSKHFLSLFARTLIGVEFPEELSHTLLKLDDFLQTPMASAFAIIPHFLMHAMPSLRSLRKECETNIQNFIRQQLQLMRIQPEKNWFTDVLASYHLDPTQLTDKDIDRLSKDTKMRACFGVILATANISVVFHIMFDHLFKTTNHPSLEKLIHEVDLRCDEEKHPYINKEKMPMMQAVFLESLYHFALKGFGIFRYTQNSVATNYLKTPSRSFVFFNYSGAAANALRLNPNDTRTFFPERFLDSNDDLSQQAKLLQKLSMPFGNGDRICPGRRMAEDVFVNQLGALILHFKNDKLSSDSEPTTYHLMKQLFFARTSEDDKHPEKIADEITTLVMDYVLTK